MLQAVNEFQSLVSQVQKSSSMVEKVVYSIMAANLIKDPAVQGSREIMDLQELYDHLERFRLEVLLFHISLVQCRAFLHQHMHKSYHAYYQLSHIMAAKLMFAPDS